MNKLLLPVLCWWNNMYTHFGFSQLPFTLYHILRIIKLTLMRLF